MNVYLRAIYWIEKGYKESRKSYYYYYTAEYIDSHPHLQGWRSRKKEEEDRERQQRCGQTS